MASVDFNPVKEEKDGVKARRVVWSTKAIDAAISGLDEGRRLVANPFYDNNPRLLKSDLVFQRTKEEIEEWKRCCNDIIYFANTYCKLMTPEGIQHIILRDYQEEYLRHLIEHNMSIMLSARQAGKCVTLTTNVLIKLNQKFFDLYGMDWKVKFEKYKIWNIDESDVYKIPIFEILNIFEQNKVWKIKYNLYKKIYQKNRLSYLYIKLISWLDKLEKSDFKFVKSHIIEGIEIKTDIGFSEVSEINLTIPYEIYTVRLENGLKLRCADNHILFRDDMNMVFVQDLKAGDVIQTIYGSSKVTDIDQEKTKVCMCDLTVDDFNSRYYTNGILSHNTTTSSIFILHFILFNTDKNVLILGNKFRTSKDILDKFKEIYYQLPFFLKPGVQKWNEAEVCLDNGCRIKAEATTEKSGIGMSIHLALLDEFAHVAPNIIDKFYNNLLPVISATKGRVIITSTQNGYNLFYRLWQAAKQKISDYWPFEVTWDMIPEWNPDKRCWEKRDEAWHQKQVANYGSEEAFNAQFGTNFDVSANTLINTTYLRKKQREAVEFVNKDLLSVSYSEYFFWKPDYEPMEDLRKDFITVTVDIAEGGGGDYTIFNFNRMTKEGDECIGYFRCNTIGIDKVVIPLIEISLMYLNSLQHCISLEYNTYGELFVAKIREAQNKYPNLAAFDESNFVKYYNDTMSSFRVGIKITPATKSMGCKLFKEQYEKGIISNNSTSFLIELENFCDSKGNDTYQASFGHDDIVMSQIQLVHAKQSNAYKLLRSSFESALELSTKQEVKQDTNNMIGVDYSSMYSGQYFDPTTIFNNMDIYNVMNQQNSNLNRLK